MKRPTPAIAFLLSVCAGAVVSAQTTKPVEPDNRSFELTPTAPPALALKYHLLCEAADRLPGNAAPLYLDAALLMGDTAPETADKAIDAYAAGDFKKFEELAGSIDLPAFWDELGPASRRSYCDFEAPMREKGVYTLLPHLHPLRSIAWLVRTRALLQARQGKSGDAIATLRLGYEISGKLTEPVLVSALVSVGIMRMMNETIADVMARPDSPNLYWALTQLPSQQITLRRAWGAEHGWIFYCSPKLARFRAGEALSADEWRAAMVDDMAPFNKFSDDKRDRPDPVKGVSPELLDRARAEYADAHHLPPAFPAVDPAIILGEHYYREFRLAQDSASKLSGLPYPAALARTLAYQAYLDRLRTEQRTNPFLVALYDTHRAVVTFARADREIAALTAVEALRSYAAGHAGTLPHQLDDVTETPVPANPATGLPFEYKLDGDMATLSDVRTEVPLTYTVRIRK